MRKKVSIRDVAVAANVSVASVSLFLNGKPGLSDGTRQRIAEVVKQLNYTPRHQRNGTPTSSLLGLMVERLPFSMFSELHYGDVIHSMEAKAHELGYNITLVIVEPKRQSPGQMAERLKNLAGIIVLGGGDITEEIVENTLEEELPVILVDVYLPRIPIDCVLVDNFGGAYQVTKHLIDKGYEQIACIQGPEKYPSLVDRFHGYCAALIDAGRPLIPAVIQPSISSGFPNKGYREMQVLLAKNAPFDAVFCVSDRTAFGALQALQEAQRRVPQDVAVVGFDNTAQSSYTTPPLTTVNMPKTAVGEIAIRRIHHMICGDVSQEPVKSVLYTSLVVREST